MILRFSPRPCCQTWPRMLDTKSTSRSLHWFGNKCTVRLTPWWCGNGRMWCPTCTVHSWLLANSDKHSYGARGEVSCLFFANVKALSQLISLARFDVDICGQLHTGQRQMWSAPSQRLVSSQWTNKKAKSCGTCATCIFFQRAQTVWNGLNSCLHSNGLLPHAAPTIKFKVVFQHHVWEKILEFDLLLFNSLNWKSQKRSFLSLLGFQSLTPPPRCFTYFCLPTFIHTRSQ